MLLRVSSYHWCDLSHPWTTHPHPLHLSLVSPERETIFFFPPAPSFNLTSNASDLDELNTWGLLDVFEVSQPGREEPADNSVTADTCVDAEEYALIA